MNDEWLLRKDPMATMADECELLGKRNGVCVPKVCVCFEKRSGYHTGICVNYEVQYDNLRAISSLYVCQVQHYMNHETNHQ